MNNFDDVYNKTPNVGCVIVAAGSSQRMGGVDKIFSLIDGVEVIIHSIKAFADTDEISEIVVVTAEEKVQKLEKLLELHHFAKSIRVVCGGNTRAVSVVKGLEAVGDLEYVAIHDGARPFIKSQLISKTIADAKETGAAILAVKAKDTVKVVKDGVIESCPPRECVYLAQTPQVFQKKLYLDIIAENLDENVTDDSSLFEKAGYKVKITEGDYRNIKITTQEDLL